MIKDRIVDIVNHKDSTRLQIEFGSQTLTGSGSLWSKLQGRGASMVFRSCTQKIKGADEALE